MERKRMKFRPRPGLASNERKDDLGDGVGKELGETIRSVFIGGSATERAHRSDAIITLSTGVQVETKE
jgi:hypothetical protein